MSSYLLKLADRAPEILQGQVIHQAGALCFRIEQSGTTKVLLLSSRRTGRWVIPKGSIERGEKPRQCAAREAHEEAGIVGKVARKPLGYYTYLKNGKERPLVVAVFPLQVKDEISAFPEKGQRIRSWFPLEEAAAAVAEPELKGLFRLARTRLR